MTNNPWTTLSSKSVYTNAWIDVSHHDILDPSGKPGIYGKVHFKNVAVGVIPLDENLSTWLVGQYRYPIDQYSWEIPEGGCPQSQTPLEAAQRELKEETGIVASQYKLIQTLHTSNAVCDEIAYLYVATSLTFYESEPEDCEKLSLKKLPFSNVLQMVLDSEITDVMSVAAIYKTNYLIKNNLLFD